MTSWTTFDELVQILRENDSSNFTLRFGSHKLPDLYESIDDFASQYPVLLDAVRQNTSVTHLWLRLDPEKTLAATPFLDAFGGLQNITWIQADCCDCAHEPFDFCGLNRVLRKIARANDNETDGDARAAKSTSSRKLQNLKLCSRNCSWAMNVPDAVNLASSLAQLKSLKWFEMKDFGHINETDQRFFGHGVNGGGHGAGESRTMTYPMTSILLALGSLVNLEHVDIHLITKRRVQFSVSVYSMLAQEYDPIGGLLQLPALKGLGVSGLRFSGQHDMAFDTLLVQSPITTLTFSSCSFSPGTDVRFFRGLQQNVNLKWLVFRGVHIARLSGEFCESIYAVILRNINLVDLLLDLSCSSKLDLEQVAFLRIFSALEVNTSLRAVEFTLKSVGLDLDGAVDHKLPPQALKPIVTAIGQTVRVNECLKHLDFVLSPHDFIADGEVNKFQQERLLLEAAMKENFTIRSLDVRPILSGPSLVSIYANLNYRGRIYLKQGAKKKNGVDLLIATRNSLDCLFVHLLENPGLCYRNDN